MGRHVNAAYRMCDGLGRNEIVMVGKKSGPVLGRLWTKVHEILGQCREPVVFSSVLAGLSMACFVQKIFALSLQVVENRSDVKAYWPPIFRKGTTLTILQQIWQIVSTICCPPSGKVWCVAIRYVLPVLCMTSRLAVVDLAHLAALRDRGVV